MSDHNGDHAEHDGDPYHEVLDVKAQGGNRVREGPCMLKGREGKATSLFLGEVRSTAQHAFSSLKGRLQITNSNDRGMMEPKSFFHVPTMRGLRRRTHSDFTDYINEQRSGDFSPETSRRSNVFQTFRESLNNSISRIRMDESTDQKRVQDFVDEASPAPTSYPGHDNFFSSAGSILQRGRR